jgi:creatinine amidohydrolase
LTRLADLTWPEAAEHADRGCLLAVPLGSTEQHGPHLPLSTDADVAVALCGALAAARADVVVAPVIGYGASGEHAGFAGTLSIGQAALELLLVELGRSASETFKRMLLVNAHGGNAEPVRRATALLRSESRDVLAWMPQWDGDAHAGFVETSLQLELDRSLDRSRVRLDLAEAGATEPIHELMPALRSGGVRAVSPNGVLGDPAGASAEHGRTALGTLVRDLTATVADWAGPVGTGS